MVVFSNIKIDNDTLPKGKFFALNDSLQQQEFKFYFFVSNNSTDSGKTNIIQTDYFDVKTNNNNTKYEIIKLDGADPLYTYDRMYIYYKYLDQRSNYQVIEKVINLS